MPPIPDFTNPEWHRGRQDSELLVSIMEGKGTFMPANNMRITRDQAKDLVALVRSFGGISSSLQAPTTNIEFEQSMRRLQQQYDQLEGELKKLKKPE